MTSLHELCELLKEGDFFLLFDDLLEVIRDASVASIRITAWKALADRSLIRRF